ncbi:MAG: DUF2726 domain-containing protein [Nitrospirae bacterium]|nr:MAG: DUF2726 domain-containing protein [Nitrospirota bacterium]
MLLLGLVLLLRTRISRRQADRGDGQPKDITSPIPPGLTLTPQPLLSEAEAAFYNLLRLAVQDQFLVFAQVPVWCLVDIHTQDRQARGAFLSQVALKRVDFALVHPGSLSVVKVIELRDAAPPSPQRQTRDRLLNAVCEHAGIELIRLDGRETYTVPGLAARLGLEPEE